MFDVRVKRYQWRSGRSALAVALLLGCLTGCGGGDGDDGHSTSSPTPPSVTSPVGQVSAVDGFEVVRPATPTRLDLSAFVRGPNVRLRAISSEQPGCHATNLSGLSADVTNEGGLCTYTYAVSNQASDATAGINVLASTNTAPVLPPLSQAMTLGSGSATYDLQALLGDDWPEGYALDPTLLTVQGGSEQGSVTASGNVLTYTPPVTADWNRIVFILSNPERPGEDALGTLYVTISNDVNQAPVIGTPKYDYNAQTGAAVVTMQSEVLDLATLPGLGIRDPEGKAWQLVEVQSYSATVTPVDPQSVSNTQFTFTAATIGNHIVSYIVADHEGGFTAGLISIRVGPKERPKDWADTTIDQVTFYATPLYSETFNKGVTAAEGGWDSGVNLTSTPPGNTIAGLTGAQARAYCNANGIRLADESNLELFRTTASADGVRNRYPQQRSYLISNDGGSSFLTYNLTSGATAPYQPGTTANQYVICVKYADDGKMSYTATPDTPMSGYTNTAISNGQWWSLGNVESDGGISGLEVTDSTNVGEGTLSEANFRLDPHGCTGGLCELQANAYPTEYGAVSLRLAGMNSSLDIVPVTFWQNVKMTAVRSGVNHSPADGATQNTVIVTLQDKDGQPVPSGTPVKLTYSTAPAGGVVLSPPSQPGGTTFVSDAQGEVSIAMVNNNEAGGDVAVTINPVVAGIPDSVQTISSVFEPLVPEPTLDHITVTPQSAYLTVGETSQFVVRAYYSDGSQKVVSADTWYSSNSDIASVSPDGRVRAVMPGTVNIVPIYQGETATSAVTVVPTVSSITVTPNPANIDIGQTVQLTATARYSDGTSYPVSATWTPDASGIVSVSSTGVVKGLKAGSASIIATYQGQTTISWVNVAASLSSISVTPPTASIDSNNTVQLLAIANYSDGTSKQITAAWSSSAASVVSVSSTGLATGHNAGSANITATYQGKTGSSVVTVVPTVSSITVMPNPANIDVGQTVQLTATAHYSDGSSKVVTPAWSSSAGSLVSVSSTGLAKGLNTGSANITATYQGKTGSSVVTVVPTVSSITVMPNPANIDVGQTVQLTATAHYSDGSSKVVTPAWSSSAGSLVSVSSTGLAKGLNTGSANVFATYQGKTGYSLINVAAPPAILTSITVTPDTVQLNAGESVQLTVTAYYSDGHSTIVTAQSSFSGSNVVASVSTSGILTGLKAGSTPITATYQGKNDAMTVTVIQPGPIDRDYDGVLNEHDSQPDVPNSINAVNIMGGPDKWIQGLGGKLDIGGNFFRPDDPSMYYSRRKGSGNLMTTVDMQCPNGLLFSADPSYPYCRTQTEAEWAADYIRYLPTAMKTKIEAEAE